VTAAHWQARLRWPADGLLPAIAQDAETGQVLMLAWQNREALTATVERGVAHFFSRSRQQLWQKGETSGNVLHVREIRVDCDNDTILILVDPAGPACHTGKPSCFFARVAPHDDKVDLIEEDDNPWPPAHVLDRLANVIERRFTHPPARRSYVRTLAQDPELAAKKVLEEAGELVEACRDEATPRVQAEAADLMFHLLVLARTRRVDLRRISDELAGRFGISGHEEKEARRGRARSQAKDDSA